jgi:ornithine cyclodeaminase/alanine dehydrogenase-like protein (mu-crystallin family)
MSRTAATYGADEIRRAVRLDDLIEPMREAFRIEAAGVGESTISVLSPRGEDGDVHVKTAWVPGHPWFVVKVATGFTVGGSDRRVQPGGYVALHDAYDGMLHALLLDEHHLTDLRTAAASAAATDALSLASANTLAVLGTGTQALWQVLATARVRPITSVTIWGRRRDAAQRLAATIAAKNPRLHTVVAATPRDAVDAADIVLTATSSHAPVLHGEWLRPGQHVTATGADDPSKTELDVACFARADIVAIDSPKHTPQVGGDLRRAIAAGALDAPAPRLSSLGDVVDGTHPGRGDAGQISIAKLVGIAGQDLLAAEVALRRLAGEPPEGVPDAPTGPGPT